MKKNVSWFKRCLLLIPTLLFGAFLYAQDLTVTGTVTSTEDGQPVPGVSVVQKGTTNGTITDINGQYNITVPQGSVLIFSFVGMTSQEVSANSTSLNVALEPDVIGMDEVVVTALGLSREKKALGYTVTEVGSDEISTVKDVNVMNSLAGKVAGVNITQGAFGPGSSSKVTIRGNNSLTGNNQPLYVVDGIPMDNSAQGSSSSNDTGAYSKTDYGNGISDLNPDDIETMTVLKGPNAAALYGARAANGVILITTKKGTTTNGLGVTVSSSLTFDTPMILPEYQDKYGQGKQGFVPDNLDDLKQAGGSWGAMMDGSNQLYWTGETKPYTSQADNVKDFLETGSTVITSLAIDGGTENANVRFSYTNTSAQSMLPNSDLMRHNFNLRGFAKMADKLTIDAKATYFYQYGKNRPTLGTEGVMGNVYSIPRNLAIDDLKANMVDDAGNSNSYNTLGSNAYFALYNNRKEDWKNRFNGFVKIQYDFNSWLSAFVRIGTDFTNHNIETEEAYGHWYYPTGRFNFRQFKTTETNADFLFMFNKDISDRINISASVGGNHMYRGEAFFRINGEDYRIQDGPPVDIAEQVFTGYAPLKKRIVNSLYATASVSFDRWLYLDVTGRNDWSSSLPSDNWSFFYPSVSTSVLLHEAFDISGILDFAKVRLSWAEVGNDTDPFRLEDVYSIDASTDSYLGRTTMSRSNTKNNANLKPEAITSVEAGAELRFFKNRVYTDFTVYNIKSTDLIFPVPVAPATGYGFVIDNVGEIENKGFELLIGGTPIKTADLTWDISLNYSRNKNELKSLIEGTETFAFGQTNSGNIFVQGTVGGGFGEIWGTDYARTEDGTMIVNADGVPTDSEAKLLGNYQPDALAGLTNTIDYKGFTFRFLIDARFGGEFYSGTDAALDGSGVSDRTLKYRGEDVVLDAVVETGTDGDGNPIYAPNETSITGQQYWGAVSGLGAPYVYSQTNVRLREMSLTYRFPQTLIGDTFIKGASVGVIARNLFFIYKDSPNFDPEMSYSTGNYSQGILYNPLPSARSIGFNVNLKF
ncbi:SusC/RagA family TonB-linked outer membrane protein [Carboxylicivirga sp. A043]|uniref:SusC/RagA family TonB-linked outer membrane protein n=1 Tax=Carboxylicivirga litoralis TaxID=2816963 RepID=UPI0021CB951B|nr:SusC/RagA family TonB-linked outer membrane protein [Carboxylicivirga sp. A043]MCU4155740.1 SusC/RagA family TonB-linked outer membrane protein [Carboxylicivirga sp. A043]